MLQTESYLVSVWALDCYLHNRASLVKTRSRLIVLSLLQPIVKKLSRRCPKTKGLVASLRTLDSNKLPWFSWTQFFCICQKGLLAVRRVSSIEKWEDLRDFGGIWILLCRIKLSMQGNSATNSVLSRRTLKETILLRKIFLRTKSLICSGVLVNFWSVSRANCFLLRLPWASLTPWSPTKLQKCKQKTKTSASKTQPTHHFRDMHIRARQYAPQFSNEMFHRMQWPNLLVWDVSAAHSVQNLNRFIRQVRPEVRNMQTNEELVIVATSTTVQQNHFTTKTLLEDPTASWNRLEGHQTKTVFTTDIRSCFLSRITCAIPQYFIRQGNLRSHWTQKVWQSSSNNFVPLYPGRSEFEILVWSRSNGGVWTSKKRTWGHFPSSHFNAWRRPSPNVGLRDKSHWISSCSQSSHTILRFNMHWDRFSRWETCVRKIAKSKCFQGRTSLSLEARS